MIMTARHPKLLMIAAAALFVAACESDTSDSDRYQSDVPVGQDTTATNQGTTTPTTRSPVAELPYEPGSGEELEAVAGSRVYFGFDRYDLTARAQQTLRDQAAFMRKYPRVSVLVEGHADERGTREYNLALGARRANAAKRFLVSLGIDPNRIRTISYGKERPEAIGSNERAWAQNRRGVTVVQ
ncbi:MAG: peptidoglycan-associated lipoprotein Pal [Alphaproteobacteria bacterium]